jgi:outer membrane protein assembly factor BamB
MWGFSSSPLVTDGVVAIHAGGKDDKGILAFDTATGDLRWSAAASEQSYGSLQVVTLQEQRLLGLLTDQGAQFLDPTSGKTMFTYEWKHGGYRALQPQILDGNKVLIATGMGSGTRLVEVAREEQTFSAKELWTSRDLKPDFNDVVPHEGFLYGFDNTIFACIDLKDGSLKWKDGRYGKGQVLLLADSDLLLVVSEKGNVVLLKADPAGHQVVGKLNALEGKTWNHPVVVGDRLYLRNAREAACYRLPTTK